jgi:3-phosphoshikimate 1-carboxyvinyltransferase
MSVNWQASRSQGMRGNATVPGDKSISHRAIMLSALAEGVSTIEGFLEGEDTRATARIFTQLGVKIETPNAQTRVVHGVGLHGLTATDQPLDCGNAGTGMRLLTGLLSGQAFDSQLIGDASLSKRPMARVIKLLEKMGAQISAREDNFAPLNIKGSQSLQSVEINTLVASAQVKSALIFAALYAQGETIINEPRPTRDYTESMLKALGWPIEYTLGRVVVQGSGKIAASKIQIPGDISSAAFIIAGALLIPNSDITLLNIGINPRRTGIIEAFQLMGGRIEYINQRIQSGEMVADIRVQTSTLVGINLPERLVPDMIDECPIFFIVAALAKGTTHATGLAELRVKESDRIASMVNGLKLMGADISDQPDSVVIQGGLLHAAEIESFEDHRIAMSFAIAAQCIDGVTTIRDCANVATSFPGFVELAQSLGMKLNLA